MGEGLARVLEHTSEKHAQELGKIIESSKLGKAISVSGFSKIEQQYLRVASINYNNIDDLFYITVPEYSGLFPSRSLRVMIYGES